MQKLINTVALLSGLVSLSVVGAGSYLYLNKDAIVEDARRKVTAAITVAITDALPGMIDACLLYTSPSPRDRTRSRMPSSA